MTRLILEKAVQAHLEGNLKKAKNLYREALKSGNNHPAAHANLGVILKEEGELKEAINETEKALKISPNDPVFLMNAGGLYLELNEYSLSIKYSQKSLSIQPSNPIALANLGCALKERGDILTAETLILESLKIQPENPITLTAMGFLQLTNNKPEDALNWALKAVKAESSSPRTHLLLAKALEAKGKLPEAKISFQKSLELDKNNASAIFGLSCQSATSKETIELLKSLNRINKTKLNTSDLTSLHYAYSNLYHSLKEYQLATKHLKKAHKIKSTFSPSNSSEIIQGINFFRQQSKQRFSVITKSQSVRRIFIVGMPRSGSTLLESVLSMNPHAKDLGESRAMNPAIKSLIESSTKAAGSAPSLEDLYSRNIGLEEPHDFQFTIDKQLFNFMFSGLMASHIPNAKIIHCKRNPLDNILSMLRNNLGFGSEFTTSARDSALVLIEQEKAMLEYKKTYKNQILTFDYDCFVKNPRSTILPIVEWLGFNWEDSYLHPEKNTRSVSTASAVQARQPINKKSLSSWKNYKELLEPALRLIRKSELFAEYNL